MITGDRYRVSVCIFSMGAFTGDVHTVGSPCWVRLFKFGNVEFTHLTVHVISSVRRVVWWSENTTQLLPSWEGTPLWILSHLTASHPRKYFFFLLIHVHIPNGPWRMFIRWLLLWCLTSWMLRHIRGTTVSLSEVYLFHRCPKHGSCHVMCRRMQASYRAKLRCCRKR